MDFDLSKLTSDQSKASETKAKPRFGPAARARPKPKAKSAEEPAPARESAEARPQGAVAPAQPSFRGTAVEEQHVAVASDPSNHTTNTSAAAPVIDTVPAAPVEGLERRFKPTAGKRKAADAPEASDAAQRSHDAAGLDAMAIVPAEATAEDLPAAAAPSTGPMTKAKKRKGMGKGAGAETHKTRTPLAEQTIDPHTMPMKTIIKCAMAKDRVKASAEQAAKAAAAMEQASASRPQPSQAIHLESEAIGAPQMILDEETGQLVLDPSSLTMQAQPRQEYTRREEGQHDIVNSQSYMKRENTARWSPEETEEFYSALQIWGTNFNYVATRINSRMAALGLPCNNRSHRQVKLKYKREEKAHPKKVTAAINGQHAQSDDYVEMIHELQAAQNEVQQDDSTYLEAAPSDNAKDTQPMDCSVNPLPYGSASDPVYRQDSDAEADELREDEKAGTGLICSAPNQESSRGRPRMKSRLRASKAAHQNCSLVEGQVHDTDATNGAHLQQQQQQEGIPDEAQDRFTRMLRDSGVTAEELADGAY
ncbi:TPA: hypothetical protein ACH3X2_011949 [Trebouxia sp. C0005]